MACGGGDARGGTSRTEDYGGGRSPALRTMPGWPACFRANRQVSRSNCSCGGDGRPVSRRRAVVRDGRPVSRRRPSSETGDQSAGDEQSSETGDQSAGDGSRQRRETSQQETGRRQSAAAVLTITTRDEHPPLGSETRRAQRCISLISTLIHTWGRAIPSTSSLFDNQQGINRLDKTL